MGKKLTVAVIHGIGSQTNKTGFDNGMINEIKGRLKRMGKSPSHVTFKTIYWADVLMDAQKSYLREAVKNHDVDNVLFRKFIISFLGDASAYRRVAGDPPTSSYYKIHKRVAESIKSLADKADDADTTPLVVMAHSLGGHIMSNYIWDMQKTIPVGGKMPATALERMETLAGFITFGCNIPLFTFALTDVKPIKFPGKALSPAHRPLAEWLNYYDPDDVLGYPLAPISTAYGKAGIQDIPINVGNILTSWNPACHSGYWTDNDLTVPAARYLAQFL